MTNSSSELPPARWRETQIVLPGPEHIEPIRRILIETAAFTDEQVRVAVELVELSIRDPEGDYQVRVLSTSEEVIGYTCFGRAPFTEGVFDLYWIAVDPRWQGAGAARWLMQSTEQEIRGRGGRLLLVETASKLSYDRTRRFYEALGYLEAARVRDYYRMGDDKVIYEKRWAQTS